MKISSQIPVLMPFVHSINDWDNKQWKGDLWILHEDWNCKVSCTEYEYTITVKRGFITDGGSVPNMFTNIIAPMGVYLVPFLLHDTFYGAELISRELADTWLFDYVNYYEANWLISESIYLAVDSFGDATWDKHKTKYVTELRDLVDMKFTTITRQMYNEIKQHESASIYQNIIDFDKINII